VDDLFASPFADALHAPAEFPGGASDPRSIGGPECTSAPRRSVCPPERLLFTIKQTTLKEISHVALFVVGLLELPHASPARRPERMQSDTLSLDLPFEA
jgi:hypothetical protein